MAIVELSKSQVRKAGQVLKGYRRSGQILSVNEAEKVERAIVVVQQFRAAHQHPLVTANNGLRSMVRTVGCQVEVSQRLKRFNTILDKLVREPNLPLSSMQDIGGVRAILNSIDEVRGVEARLKHNRPVLGYRDYIASPRKSGYRGVHVVVEYNSRQIEVQLRTRVMHDWATTVERLSSRVGENLKGDGDHAVQEFLAAVSRAMALEEHGGIVESSTVEEINHLRAIAEPYLRGGL